jgi:mRNA interferase MazF
MNRGEVWLINLDPTIGSEIKKTRPAVIVSNDLMGKLPLKIIVPITAWRETFTSAPWHVKLDPDGSNGLKKRSSADTFQVRSVSDQRLVKKIGALSGEGMDQIVGGLVLSMSLSLV